jgi:hypothetical protein
MCSVGVPGVSCSLAPARAGRIRRWLQDRVDAGIDLACLDLPRSFDALILHSRVPADEVRFPCFAAVLRERLLGAG